MIPIIFLLLFVYVFGGTLGAGLGAGVGGPSGGRAEPLDRKQSPDDPAAPALPSAADWSPPTGCRSDRVGSPTTSPSHRSWRRYADWLLGGPIGNGAAIAVGWCVGIALLAQHWAKRLFNRRPAH